MTMGWRVEVMEMKSTPSGLQPTGTWRPLGQGWKTLHTREEAQALAACFRPPTRVVETGSPGVPSGAV